MTAVAVHARAATKPPQIDAVDVLGAKRA